MAVPMMQPAQGDPSAMQSAIQQADPRALQMQPVGASGPTPQDQSSGIVEQLKTIVMQAQAIAQNSIVSQEMNGIQKLAIQAAMKLQQQQSGSPQATQY